MAKQQPLTDALRLTPGAPVDLAGIDTRATPGLSAENLRPNAKEWSRQACAALGVELADLQQRLYARRNIDPRRLLIVLQAMDCGGKDGTIKNVAGMLNPQGVTVTSFGVPTPEERAHHFLWRIRRGVPQPGYVGIFNRSHYEDVLIVRVHNLVHPDDWMRRYDEINAFERELAGDGVVLLKIMLHISREEQCLRLRERLTDPTKHWKYNPTDLDERAFWADYQAAYADALTRCGTAYAPWHVVPADRKWYRNWAVTSLVRETFAELALEYPAVEVDLPAERARLDASCASSL
jgi:PPK2 family polyphosphate:nucleotide phosphotransferase